MPALKYSRQRESIKENLMHRSDHPTADMVYSDIRKIYPNISLGTVYRNLSLLSDLGEIRKLVTSDGAVRFDADTSPHNHFTCRKCGAVLDLDMEDISQIKAHASRNFDGIIENFSVNFYGLCGWCVNHS
jgi:Fur family peroxide stress response transcriptional regulator